VDRVTSLLMPHTHTHTYIHTHTHTHTQTQSLTLEPYIKIIWLNNNNIKQSLSGGKADESIR
jgi:hypothetical protein